MLKPRASSRRHKLPASQQLSLVTSDSDLDDWLNWERLLIKSTLLLSDVEMAMRYHNLRVLMCLRLTAPQLLGMVKTEEPLDSDVISNIQWVCEKIETIGREMAFTSCCSCGPKGNGQAKGLSNTMLCHLTKMFDHVWSKLLLRTWEKGMIKTTCFRGNEWH